MEPLFINRYVRDKAVHQEIQQYYSFKSPISVVYFISIALLLLGGLGALEWSGNGLGYFLWAAALLACAVWRYFRNLSVAIKRDLENHGQQPTVTYHVTETGITLFYEDIALTPVPFSQIRRAIETKHLILLLSSAKQLHIFHKEGFVLGSLPEFNQLLCRNKIRYQ